MVLDAEHTRPVIYAKFLNKDEGEEDKVSIYSDCLLATCISHKVTISCSQRFNQLCGTRKELIGTLRNYKYVLR